MTEYSDIPEDPHGYRIAYTDDGGRFTLTRIADEADLGTFDTRNEAVAAAEADRG